MKENIRSEEYQRLLRWLRARRMEAGLSMRSMGTLMNVPHTWIQKIEQGNRRLDLLEYTELCKALQCDPQEGLHILEAANTPKRKRKKTAKNPFPHVSVP